MRTLALALVVASSIAVGFSSPAPDTSIRTVGSSVYSNSLKGAINDLPVKVEVNEGYSRESYPHWTDPDMNSCDTRQDVLWSESKTTLPPPCDLTGGEWVSYFDGVSTTAPSTFDVDHLVPLAEAHGSGAYKWDSTTREAYANDLADKRSLAAVSASSNRSKSDRDPAEWLPPKESVRCRYVSEWVAVKHRWGLSIDQAEKKTLLAVADTCGDKTVRVTKASTNNATPSTEVKEGLKVVTVAYDPPGADTLNGEWVKVTNVTDSRVDLKGWSIKDEAGGTYVFSSGRLGPSRSLKLYTGSGSDAHPSYFAGRGQAWWNNGGDTVYVLSPSSTVVQSSSYVGTGDGGRATF